MSDPRHPELTAIFNTAITILAGYRQEDDPARRHLYFVDKINILFKLATEIVRGYQHNDMTPDQQAKFALMTDHINEELRSLAEWIKQPRPNDRQRPFSYPRSPFTAPPSSPAPTNADTESEHPDGLGLMLNSIILNGPAATLGEN